MTSLVDKKEDWFKFTETIRPVEIQRCTENRAAVKTADGTQRTEIDTAYNHAKFGLDRNYVWQTEQIDCGTERTDRNQTARRSSQLY